MEAGGRAMEGSGRFEARADLGAGADDPRDGPHPAEAVAFVEGGGEGVTELAEARRRAWHERVHALVGGAEIWGDVGRCDEIVGAVGEMRRDGQI